MSLKLIRGGSSRILHIFVIIHQLGPYIHSKYDREFKWAAIVERDLGIEDEFDRPIRQNETDVNVVLKSEAWINGFCYGTCPNNCTQNQEAEASWIYIQKSALPIKEDLRITDKTIRVMCKGTIALILSLSVFFISYKMAKDM